MELFTERKGLYVSPRLTPGASRSPFARIILSFLPIAVMAFVFLMSSRAGEELPPYPFLLMLAVFLFINILAFSVRRFSTAGRIVVDQMQGTVAFTPVGGSRMVLPASDLENVTVSLLKPQGVTTTDPAGTGRCWTALGLADTGGRSYRITLHRDAGFVRMLADELAVLTSLTVSEDTCDG